jgi:hypothetical protein
MCPLRLIFGNEPIRFAMGNRAFTTASFDLGFFVSADGVRANPVAKDRAIHRPCSTHGLEKLVDFHLELGFQQFLSGVAESEIGKNVATALS